MNPQLHVDDVVAARPSTKRMVVRAIGRRCPRCGSGGLFDGWFHLRVRCPGCGYKFKREPGFFLGAFTFNLVVTLAALFLVLMSAVLFGATQREVPFVQTLIVGIGCATLLPMAFYPISITLWIVFDLTADPLDLDEIVDAVDALGGPTEDPKRHAGRPPGDLSS